MNRQMIEMFALLIGVSAIGCLIAFAVIMIFAFITHWSRER